MVSEMGTPGLGARGGGVSHFSPGGEGGQRGDFRLPSRPYQVNFWRPAAATAGGGGSARSHRGVKTPLDPPYAHVCMVSLLVPS